MTAFDFAWALLKSDDFYEAFRRQNPDNPTMQEAMSMQQDREFREAFQPNHPRMIPQSEYNPYDPSMVKVKGRGGGSLHPDGSFTPHDNPHSRSPSEIEQMLPPPFQESAPIPFRQQLLDAISQQIDTYGSQEDMRAFMRGNQ